MRVAMDAGAREPDAECGHVGHGACPECPDDDTGPGSLLGVLDDAAPAREPDGAVGPLRDADGPAAVPGQLAGAAGRVIVIEALGAPAPKGSSRAFVNKRTGRAFVAPGGAKSTEERVASWDVAVRAAARVTLDVAGTETIPFVGRAIAVSIVFRMRRPAGHWGKGKRAGQLLASAPARPSTKPDIDKLARTTLDALTGSVFDDDSRIADLVLSKRWAAPGREGATITVREAAP